MASVFRIMYTPLFDEEEPNNDELLSMPPFGESFIKADDLIEAINKLKDEIIGNNIQMVDGGAVVATEIDEDEDEYDEDEDEDEQKAQICTNIIIHAAEFICVIDIE